MVGIIALAAILSVRGDLGSLAAKEAHTISALAPVDVIASGFEQPSALAVEPSGAILITDRARGTLTRIDASGRRRILLDHLHGPTGVAIDSGGNVLVVEAAGRRVLMLDRSGLTTVVTSALRQLRAIAVGPDGRIWLALRRDMGRESDDDDDGDRGGGSGAEFAIARLEHSGTLTTVASGLMGVQGLAADGAAVYVALARLVTERGRTRTTVARVPIREDGTAAPVEALLSGSLKGTRGLAIDALGDVFVSAEKAGDEHDGGGVILKRHRTGQVTALATGLKQAVALVFAPDGDLVALERGKRGRVLRFRAPPAPVPDAPAFTNRTPVPIGGHAGPRDRVQVFPATDVARALATTVADAATGDFALEVPLTPNSGMDLSFLATGAAGSGLTGPAMTVHIVHDDRLPTVTIAEPSPGVHARDVVALRGRGEDEGSGVASMAFMLDEAVVATMNNEASATELSAVLDTRAVVEGPHALTLVATDRAGNAASAAQLLVVDRTPPDTAILSGPSREIFETTATFVVAGTDVYSPVIEFAWRLDRGPWSPFGPATTIVLNNLASGAHTFEVKARDLAGNENELTPAVQAFTVIALRIRITEPTEGAVITTPSVWVLGTVQAGGEVTVTIPLPPGLGIPAVPASTAGGTFAAEVPIDTAMTTLTAIATDVATGQTATHTIGVTVQPDTAASMSGFTALPAAGLAPHVVTFSINLGEGARVELDLDSNGTVDFDGTTVEGLPFVYDQPGIYVPTLRAMTADGQVLRYRTVVEVYDRAALDARLQAVWTGFTDALQAGDVARAVSFIHGKRRAAWQEHLGALLPDELSAERSMFTTIDLIQVGRGGAEYEMLREEDGRVLSYPIVFIADADGRWRLWQF